VAARSGAHLLVLSDGPLRPALQELARQLGVARRVSFLGPRRDVAAFLKGAQVFVLVARWEGLPVVLEAMAAGLPVVATAVGGRSEVVADGETGLLVEPEQPTALAGDLLELLQDERRRERMGRAGHQRAQQHFAPQHAARQLAQVYRQVLRGG
jgi:glycosyltransferase involved in cell wall biosynthesis